LYILEGKKAKRYFELYQFADAFAKQKRELVAKELFGDCQLISNEMSMQSNYVTLSAK